MLPSVYDLLSPAAQGLLRRTLNPSPPPGTTLGAIVARSGLDQVDIVMLLLRAGDHLMADVTRLVGHPVSGRLPALDPLLPTFVPDGSDTIIESMASSEDQATWLDDWLARHPDRFEIDNWQVAPCLSPPETPPEVAAALRHTTVGITVAELHRRGLSYGTIHMLQELGLVQLHAPHIDEAAELDHWWVARAPGTSPSAPDRTQRALLTLVRAGRTVRQLVTRGLTYAQVDELQQRGWLRLVPPVAT